MYELPPILSGSEQQQIAALRDYLVRLARNGQESAGETGGTTAIQSRNSGQRGAAGAESATKKDIQTVRADARRLRDLIIKTAEEMNGQYTELENKIDGIEGLFFYIKYSPVENPTAQQMTNTPQNDTAYMGVCSTSQATAPTDPAAYTWSRILGEDALSLEIVSSNGNIFKNGAIFTVLSAVVRLGDTDITELLDDNEFRWTRVSSDAEADRRWNQAHFGGTKRLNVTDDMVSGRATFFCTLLD